MHSLALRRAGGGSTGSHLEGVKPPLEAARQGVRQALKPVSQIRCKFLTCPLQGTLQQEALGRVKSLPGKKAQCVLPLGPLEKGWK